MKKVILILMAVALVSVLMAGLSACKKKDSADADVAPISFSYTLVRGDDAADNYYELTSVTISVAATTLSEKKDYEGLATLFNTPVEGVYEAPKTAYTKDTVRTLTIPETYKDLPVKEIASEAVVDLTFINKIVVKNNITKIGLGAFSGLSGLKEIELPFVGAKYNAYNEEKLFGYIFGTTSSTGLTSCAQTYNEGSSGNSVTYYIPSGLKTVTIVGGNTIQSETLKYDILVDDNEEPVLGDNGEMQYVFSDEGQYTTTVDTSEFSVPAYAFYNVSMVENFVLLGNMPRIEKYTFYGCSALKSFDFSDETTEVCSYAFANCSKLKSVTFNSVELIGSYAFNGCTSLGANYMDLQNELEISANEVEDHAFSGCTGLTAISFSGTDVVLGSESFSGCTGLYAVDFTNVDTIGEFAFKGCTKIESVDLSPITALESGAFYGCSSLANVTIEAAVQFDDTVFKGCDEDLAIN